MNIIAPQQRAARAPPIAFLVAGTFFMQNLDGTVIVPALPRMAESFGVAPIDLNVGMSAYLLALSILIPVSGWMADRLGTRRVFVAAIVIFTLASMLCGLSQSFGMFVAMRILQGAGGAMMVPVGRLLVLRNTPKAGLVAAIATITWPALVAPVLGPPVGGFLTDFASWRWIFYLNVPLGIAAFVAALRMVPDVRDTVRRSFDWVGFATFGLGIAGVMYGLEWIGRGPGEWTHPAALIAVCLALLGIAVLHFRKAVHPMIDGSGLRYPTFSVSIWSGSLIRMAIAAVPFLLPLMLQLGFGFDAFKAGLLTLAVFAGNLAMKTVTTRVLRRYGFRTVLIVCGIANAIALGACALFTAATPLAVMAAILFAGGLARSMQFTALSTIAFADIPAERMTGANTLFSTMNQLSASAAIAVGAGAVRAGAAFLAASGLASGAASEYRVAFVLVGLLALAGVIGSIGLPRDAGAHVSRSTA